MWWICIAPSRENFASKALGCGLQSFACQHTTPAFTRSSPGGATTEWTVTAPSDEAYYSLFDPVRMKCWVGLAGWPTADVWPTKWSSVQLAVSRRTGKVRRSETIVLPLCYAANLGLYPRTVTHPSTNPARSRATSLTCATPLPPPPHKLNNEYIKPHFVTIKKPPRYSKKNGRYSTPLCEYDFFLRIICVFSVLTSTNL